MAARSYWCDEAEKRIIVLEFSGRWTSKDYEKAMADSVLMLESVTNPTAIVMNFLSNKQQAFSKAVIDEWLTAIKRWRGTSSYAEIWISVSTGYWERLLVWTLSRIYNPTGLEVAATLDEACKIAQVKLIEKSQT